MTPEDTENQVSENVWFAQKKIIVQMIANNFTVKLVNIFRSLMASTWQLSSFALLLVLLYWHYGNVVGLLLLVIAFIGVAYNGQDLILYYPDQPDTSRILVTFPSDLPYEEVYIKTSDGVSINAILIKQPPHRLSVAPTLVYFHGNAGNIGHRVPNATLFSVYCSCNVLLVEYRGYGKSSGSISEEGLYLDAEAAVDYLLTRTDIDISKIVLFGRSLGGAVAIRTAMVPRFANNLLGLILENTFTAIPDMARCLIDIFIVKLVPSWFYKNKFPSIKRIKQVKIPTLFISGRADTLVPPAMMDALADNCGSIYRRMAKFQDGTHNETCECQGYYDCVNSFLAETYQTCLSGYTSLLDPTTT